MTGLKPKKNLCHAAAQKNPEISPIELLWNDQKSQFKIVALEQLCEVQ